MAKKLHELDEVTSISASDIVGITVNPTTAPESKKIKIINILAKIYPVGCIYTTTISTNPATVFGFGTWVAFGGGRVMVGAGTSDATYTAGATGGESNHTLSSAEMPVHTHIQDAHLHSLGFQFTNTSTAGVTATQGVAGSINTNLTTATNQNAGSGNSHNNLQPYIVVYIWKRTA